MFASRGRNPVEVVLRHLAEEPVALHACIFREKRDEAGLIYIQLLELEHWAVFFRRVIKVGVSSSFGVAAFASELRRRQTRREHASTARATYPPRGHGAPPMDPRQERAPGLCCPVPTFVEKSAQESRQVGSDMDRLVLPEAINATRAMLPTERDRHGRNRAKRGVAEAPHEIIDQSSVALDISRPLSRRC